MTVCTECGNDVAYSGSLCFDCFTHPDDPRRVAQDEEQAEARAEDLAWEHEQDMDRRVWNEVHP